MEREEIMDENFTEKEIIPTKNQRKIKISIAIISSILVISSTTLLIGYFKLDWFKSDIYKLDVQIERNIYQLNYFTETKTIETRLGFTSGISENKNIDIKTNFLVYQTGREKLENNDYLNNASLIILDMKINIENEEKQVFSFNISDEEKLKEFNSNPNASYLFTLFSFYDNGTIADINLPQDISKTNANYLIDLIEKIIPKLYRNKTEDFNNNLKVNIYNKEKIKKLVEIQLPSEMKDIKDSKYSKFIERDIENEKLTTIRSNYNISLETKNDNGEATFGLKDYFLQEKDKIILTETRKENVELKIVQNLSNYIKFIKFQELFSSFEKNDNGKKEYNFNDSDEKKINDSSKIRNLINYGTDKTFKVKEFNILGIKITFKIRIRISSYKWFKLIYFEIIITTNNGEAKFGNSGFLFGVSRTFETPEKDIFFSTFPYYLFAGFGLTGKATLTLSSDIKDSKIKVSATGNLKAKGYVWAIFPFVEVDGGAWGTIIQLTLGVNVDYYGNISRFGSIGGGDVVIYINVKNPFKPLYYEWKVFNGWYKDF